MNRFSLVLLLAIPGWFQLAAQEFSGYFGQHQLRATIDVLLGGKRQRQQPEEYKMSAGFPSCGIPTWKFNDYFMRAELLYSQKGTDYNYNTSLSGYCIPKMTSPSMPPETGILPFHYQLLYRHPFMVGATAG